MKKGQLFYYNVIRGQQMKTHAHTLSSPGYEILHEAVKQYPGILESTYELVKSLKNPSRDWERTISDLRSYSVKHFAVYSDTAKASEVVDVILDVFLEGIHRPEHGIQKSATDSLLFYLEKVFSDGASQFRNFVPSLQKCFVNLLNLDRERFSLIVTNPRQLKKMGQLILQNTIDFDVTQFNTLLSRSLFFTYEYWLSEEDPAIWIQNLTEHRLRKNEQRMLKELVYPVSHANLNELISHLKNLDESDQRLKLQELLSMPGYRQIVSFYEGFMNTLPKTGTPLKDLKTRTAYILRIIDMKGLFSIHEIALREINRAACKFIELTDDADETEILLTEIMRVLHNTITDYPETTLYCIQSIGKAFYQKGNSEAVENYLQKVISLGFQYPDIQGATEEWQVQSNLAHLKNIRTWLALIENNPKWSKSIIAALIVNLRLSGLQINDLDLFQKDITKLLDSDIAPVYHLIKQLTKLFPVFFSDINADGALREVSTSIDEVTGRSDTLIHFLRKQSHVESSSRVLELIEEIFYFWLTKDKSNLKGFLPRDIFEKTSTSGPYVDDMHRILKKTFKERSMLHPHDLLNLSGEDITLLIQNLPVSEREKKRFHMALKFYQLLNNKYRFDAQAIREQLQLAQGLGLPNADTLIQTLDKNNIYQSLKEILVYLEKLKDIILSEEQYEPVENIFRKRHIAAGIPSLYGSYHERKFDALALTYRLEALANLLFEELIHSINLKFITRATLFEIYKYAHLFFKALRLDGISSNRIENTLDLLSVALEVRRFSFSQYIDIFRGFSDAVQDILNTYFSGIFKNNLRQIILQIGTENILPRYLENTKFRNEFEFVNKVLEQFLREAVAGSFALQQLDTFNSRILKTLFEQAEGLDIQNLDLLMSYDPKKALSNIYAPNIMTNDRIHLGNKGYNLIKMAALGIRVPPGFIITTEVFRCQNAINKFKYAGDHLEHGIREQISNLEQRSGKRFGSPRNPLLVSVRSGGAISMPGMMLSFLNVGINESIIKGLIKQTAKPWFAWDCYRRFIQCWGMSFGIERDNFDEIMNSYKIKYNVPRKLQFSAKQMREVAFAYRETVRHHGIEIVDDPEMQIRIAINQVFQSWFSKKAQAYRKIMGISDNWGTAVIVQSMVYGNLDTESGTGVLFTRNPLESGDKITLWGDFSIGAQGEDIVLGLVRTLPISNEQKPVEDRTSEVSFEESFPELYNEMLQITKDLIYGKQWGAQEIEFTFEGSGKDKLFFLQTRDMTITRKQGFKAFAPSKKLSSHYLSRGIGVGGGALSGRAVFDLDEIHAFREKNSSIPLILIRSDTVPDDITHISAADGLLTARGGSTSHAAIIANRLGKTCVVGCNNLLVWEQVKECQINNRSIKAGDFLSIDGRNGAVYAGRHRVEEIRTKNKTSM